jgi:signal transduction histidine kinase
MLFEQLIEILLINSVEADTHHRFVVISASVVDRWLYIVVQDFGKGMTRLEMVSSHIRSLNTSANHWGIGLACARRIVAQYHGYLRINSWESIGTQVICTLPLARE